MCALYGLYDLNNALPPRVKKMLIRSLSILSEVRGKDAVGISFVANDGLRIFKIGKPAHKVKLYFPDKTKVVMGHTRAATNGSPRLNQNNHPFKGKAGNTTFSLEHNGIIWNDALLRKQYSLPQTQIETDSYIAVQLIEHYGKLDFESLKWISQTVQGSYVFTLLDDNNDLYFVKGDNPLELIFFEEIGVYVYASTPEILNSALKKSKLSGISHKKIPLEQGEILRISACGEIERSTFNLPTFDPWDFFTRWPISIDTDPSLHELLELGKIAGVNQEDIQVLLDLGYDTDEILELLECPKLLHQQLDFYEIGCDDFDY